MTSPPPLVPVFLGLGFTVLLCAIFCKVYSCRRKRKREREQERVREREREMELARERERERESWRSGEQDWQPPSIYFIHFSRTMSLPDEEEHYRQEPSAPPQYSNAVRCEPPPAYSELACIPDDQPPPYTVYNLPVYPVSPPSYTDKRHKVKKHVTFNV